MIISRRTLIGVALTGGAAAALGVGAAWAAPVGAAGPLTEAPRLLVDAAIPAAFVDGARSSLANFGLGLDVHQAQDALVDTIAWLGAGKGRSVIGLTATAEAILVQQMVRDGRTRWLSLAHHVRAGESAGRRHSVDDLPGNRGLEAELATAGGAWDAALGRALGLIAAGQWHRQQNEPRPAIAKHSHGNGTASFALASFVIAS